MTYDVAIVGAGVAGALVANDLARKGFSVVVLEAGPEQRHPSDNVDKFYAADAKIPSSPWPNEANAKHPTVLDMGSEETFKNPEFYMQQKGTIPFNSTYERTGGGTTNHWLGTCLRHVPNDFRIKTEYYDGTQVDDQNNPLMQHARDWPISYDDLEPWYTEAEKQVGVAGDSAVYDGFLGAHRSEPYPMPEIPLSYLDQQLATTLDNQQISGETVNVISTPQGRNSKEYDGRYRCLGNTSCIPICPIQAKYDATVHLNKAKGADQPAEIRYKHVVYKVDIDGADRVASLRYKDYNSGVPVDGMVTARTYVLAAHAIETAKLLLLSTWKTSPNKVTVANSSDQVGRNLMDHIIHLSWGIAANPLYPFRGPLSTSGVGSFRDTAKRNERAAYRIEIGNDGWSWPDIAPGKTVWRILEKNAPHIETFLDNHLGPNRKWYGTDLKESVNAVVTRQIRIAAEPEALPLPGSRVKVSDDIGPGDDFSNVAPDDKDALGIPKPQVNYEVSEYTKRGFIEGQETLQQMLGLLGVETIHTEIVGDGAAAVFTKNDITYEYGGAGHIAGTVIMGSNPADSVVDADCRSHDHENLFLLGSGVFPSLGTANPTLTIMALALRAADKIATDLQAQTQQSTYELILTTGREEGSGADKALHLGLIYEDADGEEHYSNLKHVPGSSAEYTDVYEKGHLDLFESFSFFDVPPENRPKKITGVRIGFEGESWQLDTIWITDRQTGAYYWKEAKMWFGSDHGQGTYNNPYALPLDGDRNIENQPGVVANQNTYDMRITTQSGEHTYGTDDHVYFKLFDNTGHASNLARDPQSMNQFEPGAEDDLPDFKVGFDLLSNTITKVLIFKPGKDSWRPNTLRVAPRLQPDAISSFDLAAHIPGDSLDGDHRWMVAPAQALVVQSNSKKASRSKRKTSARCLGKTKRGHRCKRKAASGGRCWQH